MLGRLSLKFRIAAVIVALVTTLSAALLWTAVARRGAEEHTEQQAWRGAVLALLADSTRSAFAEGEFVALSEHFRRIAADSHVKHAFVSDAQGRVIAASHAELLAQPAPDASADPHLLRLTCPLESSTGAVLGTLVVDFSVADHQQAQRQSALVIALLAVAGCAAIGAVGLLLGWLLTRRLERLTRAVRAFGAGRLSSRAELAGGDEVGQLAGAFDEMAGRIAAEHTRLDEANRRLADNVRELEAAEQARQRSERGYHLLLEHANDGIVLTDAEPRIRGVNQRFCELVGYSREELLDQPYTLLLPPGEQERQPLVHPETLRAWHPTIERHYLRKDGRIVSVELGATQQDDTTLCIVRDITERKAHEASLRESEQLFRTLLGAVFDGIAIHEDGLLIECNPAYERMFGYSREELVGRNIMERIAPEYRELVNRMRNLELTEPFEAVSIHKDGRRVHFECIARYSQLGGRRVRVAALRDITERKRREAVLLEREASLREAQQVASMGSWTTDFPTGTVMVSEELMRLFGLPPLETRISTRRFLSLIDREDRRAVNRNLQAMARGSVDQVESEYRIRTPDGSQRVLLGRQRLVRNESGIPLRAVGITQDITERKNLERQLAQAMKMEAVGQLTGGVAHDFNNLLTIILGNLRLLQRAGQLSEAILAEAVGAAERGAHLVQRLLAFSRRTALRPQPLDVNALIGETADLLKRTLGEQVQVETQPAADLWLADVDRGQLETALINLALNARDAMPQGGRLTIGTANVNSTPAQAGMGRTANGPFVCLSVCDTGLGMTPDVLEHAFDPFFTTKDVGRGTGLGLSMVYGFATQSGGWVDLRSTAGEGTTVELYLPRAARGQEPVPMPMPMPPASAAPEASATSAATCVLLVEDDPGVRRVTARILATLGHTVLEAADGSNALALLERSPHVDVLFTDVVMPGGMDGLQLAQAAQQRRPELCVLLTTGYSASLAAPVRTAGLGWPMLPKPYGAQELQRALQKVLQPRAASA